MTATSPLEMGRRGADDPPEPRTDSEKVAAVRAWASRVTGASAMLRQREGDVDLLMHTLMRIQEAGFDALFASSRAGDANLLVYMSDAWGANVAETVVVRLPNGKRVHRQRRSRYRLSY